MACEKMDDVEETERRKSPHFLAICFFPQDESKVCKTYSSTATVVHLIERQIVGKKKGIEWLR